ncbi:DNA ligase [Enterobacter phage 02_vB_Eclo_IJM]|nr:DNA ligase [Enterobacter phage 02_vB_Eclo_IJM]
MEKSWLKVWTSTHLPVSSERSTSSLKNYDFHDGDWDLKSKTTPFRLDPDHIKVVVYGIVDLDVINDPKAEGPIHSVTRLKPRL